MAVWGPGPFENDDAADWTRRFQADGVSALDPVFTEVNTSRRRVGMAAAAEAIAAAEVLAAGLGGSQSDSMPEIVRGVLAAEPIESRYLVKAAQRAVARVRADSDLRMFWQASPDRSPWEAALDDLQQRLSQWSPVETSTRPGKRKGSAHGTTAASTPRHQRHPERLPIQSRPPPRRIRQAPRPSTYVWFQAYCWLMVAVGGASTLLGFLAIVGIVRNEGTGGPLDIAFPFVLGGIVLIGPYLAGIYLPRKPWVWGYDLALIALGIPTCLIFGTLPLLVFWVRRDVRMSFGRA